MTLNKPWLRLLSSVASDTRRTRRISEATEDEATWLILGYLKGIETEKDEAVAKLAELAAKVVKKSGGDRWKT